MMENEQGFVKVTEEGLVIGNGKRMESVLERMERLGQRDFAKKFCEMQNWPYEQKVRHAEEKSLEFIVECQKRGLNYHVSVGGLDSITLFLFLLSRFPREHIPAISASYLEDFSIQEVHKAIGVERLKPLVNEAATKAAGHTVYYSKASVIRKFGFPVLSKEKAAKIELLQAQTPKSATVRHAIITGETGAYGGNQTHSRMKMPQKWLELFGGYENEREGTHYGKPDFKVSAKCCYYLKERPCDIWAKEHNSVPFLGLMASEGGRREKSLKLHGCTYFGASTIRCAPFAIFNRQDILQLALDLRVPVPDIYGEIVRDPDGMLRTTGAQRTGCSMCGFGIHMEKRPHRFDRLRERKPKEWDFWMNRICTDPDTGEAYGWGRVLDYIGVGWRDVPGEAAQTSLFDG